MAWWCGGAGVFLIRTLRLRLRARRATGTCLYGIATWKTSPQLEAQSHTRTLYLYLHPYLHLHLHPHHLSTSTSLSRTTN